MKITLRLLRAATDGEINTAFDTIVQQRIPALLVGSDPFFTEHGKQIVALAARHAVPAIYQFREFPQAGGLASYGIRLSDAYHQSGLYVGRILKGTAPGELPFVRIDRFELVINLRTVTLGLGQVAQGRDDARLDGLVAGILGQALLRRATVSRRAS